MQQLSVKPKFIKVETISKTETTIEPDDLRTKIVELEKVIEEKKLKIVTQEQVINQFNQMRGYDNHQRNLIDLVKTQLEEKNREILNLNLRLKEMDTIKLSIKDQASLEG